MSTTFLDEIEEKRLKKERLKVSNSVDYLIKNSNDELEKKRLIGIRHSF